MRTTLGALSAAAFLLTLIHVVAAGEDKDARAAIDKGIQAAGGETKLATFQASTWKEKGTYYGMGDGLPYTATYAVQWPDKFRMEVEGVFLMVLNGDKGWVKSGGKTMDMDKDEMAAQMTSHRAAWVASLMPLKDKAFVLKSQGEVKVGEDPARAVQVTRKD